MKLIISNKIQKNPDQIILFSNVGEKMSNIKDYFINENDQVYAYLNHENEFYVEKIVANSVPRAFHKHKPSHLLKITQFCSIQDEFSFFFTNGDIVFFIPQELNKIIMFHTNYVSQSLNSRATKCSFQVRTWRRK